MHSRKVRGGEKNQEKNREERRKGGGVAPWLLARPQCQVRRREQWWVRRKKEKKNVKKKSFFFSFLKGNRRKGVREGNVMRECGRQKMYVMPKIPCGGGKKGRNSFFSFFLCVEA